MYIPLWEDSQCYTIKPTSDLAEDCQVWCRRDEKIEEKSRYMLHVTCYMLYVYILLIYTYHCEKIHSGMPSKPTSDLAEDCQVSTLGRWKLEEHVTESALYNFDVRTTVRGFIVVYHETCVRSGRGLPDLTLGRWKWRNYITDSYMLHVLYIANIYIPLWEDLLLIVLYIILICTYHCERIHSGI